MHFTAVSFVFAITVLVAFSQGAYPIPYGYRLVPINNYYPAAAAPLAGPASTPAAPGAYKSEPINNYYPAAAAPLAGPELTPAAPGAYKSEAFSTPSFSKSELRDDAGQYALSYVTADGINVSERSYLKQGKEGYFPVKEGTYKYTSPEGIPVSFDYKADENGYVVKGYALQFGPGPVPAKA